MDIKVKIQIKYLQEAVDFLSTLPEAHRQKIFFNIEKVAIGIKDETIFKKLENSEIWEFRTTYNKVAYRLFAFWDNKEKALIVATNGFVKKTQKTPVKEMSKAEELMKKYYTNNRKL